MAARTSLPAALQAEQQLLGAVLLDPEALAIVRASTGEALRDDDFTDPAHRLIWRAVRTVADSGRAVDMVSTVEELQRLGEDERAGGIAYLDELCAGVAATKAAGTHAKAVIERAQRRRAFHLADELRAAALAETSPEHFRNRADTIAGRLADTFAGAIPAAPPTPSFRAVAIDSLSTTAQRSTLWWWDGYLPRGHVTVLTGHGGVGKSLTALMLTVCLATGRPLFGVPTTRCRVLFFSAEDGAELLQQRLLWICAGMGIDSDELAGWLHVLDATEGQPVLFTEVTSDGRRVGVTTAAHADLAHYIDEHCIDVAVVDNMSDTFDANEIERARVRAYMRSLVQLRQAERMTVLLLAHVDKGTARGERGGSEAYSGSTAVHNSARSRLYLAREKDGALILEHQKCNLAPLRQPLRLEWPEGGLPRPEALTGGHVAAIAAAADLKALLRLIAEFTVREEYVSPAVNSPSAAPRLLANEPGYPKGRKPAEILAMLREAERAGLLTKQQFRGTDRHTRDRWALTPAGQAFIAPRAGSAGSAGSE